MDSKEIKPHTCPSCGYLADRAAAAPGYEQRTPIEGDISICLNCGHIAVFAEAGRLRMLTLEEMTKLMESEHADVIQRAQESIIKRGKLH